MSWKGNDRIREATTINILPNFAHEIHLCGPLGDNLKTVIIMHFHIW